MNKIKILTEDDEFIIQADETQLRQIMNQLNSDYDDYIEIITTNNMYWIKPIEVIEIIKL